MDEEQDAIATRLLAELEDEQAWQSRFDATTDDQWDNLAALVRQKKCKEISAASKILQQV
ncbi:hypothetical protein PGN35_025130 [Nodosilinea sp. PGN35]|uniref:hypothetical protein n=1 Tax=Nodosilinea sp. PGN35 TaxID=3020489 RepID=UPI0023B25A71|nr:hypothetical protein [Nodosilinea sp. TSF1-S3]